MSDSSTVTNNDGIRADTTLHQRPFEDLVCRDDLPEELGWADKGEILDGPVLYHRLGPDEIRMVILYAGDQSTDLRLTTEVRKIEDAEGDYAAMSYVWGDPADTSLIYVDRHEFAATRNLVAALHRVRQLLRENETLSLWIDAICINQADVEERNSQVAMMKQIYENSTLIITWLGEAGSKGLKYLDELAYWAYGPPEDRLQRKAQPKPISMRAHVQGRYAEMKEAAGLIANEYWKRVWTVQEYSSPRLGIFICGDWWMDKSSLVPSLQAYMQALRALRAGYESSLDRNASFVDATIWEVRKLIQHHKLSYARAASDMGLQNDDVKRFGLLTMLLKFRDLKSTNPLDKVYAPLCLSMDDPELTLSIPINYHCSARELFTRAAVACMRSSEWSLVILELCRFGIAPDLPSWVPDWRTLPRAVLSRDTTTGRPMFRAAEGVLSSPSGQPYTVLENDVLQLHGIQVDVVTQLWEPMDSRDLRDKTQLSISADDLDQEYVVTGEKMSEIYRKMLSPKMHGDYPDEGNENELVVLTRNQWRTVKGVIGRINRRRLVKTGKGFVGLVPAEAELGDAVWLLQGGGVFYLLRSTDQGGKHLIGEGFFHGLMEGQLATRLGMKACIPQIVVVV